MTAIILLIQSGTTTGQQPYAAPLDGVISAYSGALRKKNSYQTYVNKKVFIAEMDRICECGPFEIQKSDEQTPGMDLQP
jgi:hypothetical protein